MHPNDAHRQTTQRQNGRDGLRDLLRRPAVGVVLVLTAGAQVLAVQAKGRPHAGESSLRGVVARLDPLVVAAPGASKAAEASSESSSAVATLVSRYRSRGFKVSQSLGEIIHEAAEENDIDPAIAFGLVRTESGFSTTITSRVGAVGLTQLMPATAKWLEPGTTRRDLRDPETNVRIGFKYLRSLIERYDGNVNLALTAYNRGPGTVDRVLKRGGNPDNGYAAFVRTGKRGKHRG